MSDFEIVVGLEVHVQAKTQTKLFCGCSTAFGAEQNTQICPVCTGQPGALPVLNKQAVNLAMKAGLALGCNILQTNVFARKNYFYPDLPKGYQISQFDLPICGKGALEIELKDGRKKTIGITRIHLEEDAGKNVHLGADGIYGATQSLIDLNRACTPLLEIVSEPDMNSIEEVRAYLDLLKLTLQYLEVSDADMEKGQLRADVNVSLRPKGSKDFGIRAEIKNMNSFRGIEKAIQYEVSRQTEILNSGGTVVQETRNYDDNLEITTTLRSKEEAHDYRYFPEPDLLPLIISDDWLAEIKNSLKETPSQRKQRYLNEYLLGEYDTDVLLNNKDLADFFEATVAICKQPKLACNWLTGDTLGYLKEQGLELNASCLTPQNLGQMISLIYDGTISGKIAKTVLLEIIKQDIEPKAVIAQMGLEQISDDGALETIIQNVIAQNPQQLADYKSGKDKLFGFFVGQVMKESQGKANPAKVNELLKKNL